MKIVAIIPARWASTRLKTKVLADIGGKPMVQHVWENVKQVKEIDDVIVAVDRIRIKKTVESFGGKAIMTSEDNTSGTDRIVELLDKIEGDIFLNVQADEPLLSPNMIEELIQVFDYEPNTQVATLVKRIEQKEDIKDPNVVKVVIDRRGYALYFSRSPIPYLQGENRETYLTDQGKEEISDRFFKHIGVYAYTRSFLKTFSNFPRTTLEMEEKLEQLRILEHGYRIKTVETRYDVMSVDTYEDLEKVRLLWEQRV